MWVVFSWFAAAGIAAFFAGAVCLVVYRAGILGLIITVGINLALRRYLRRRSDAQEARVRQATRERMHPEEYALEDER